MSQAHLQFSADNTPRAYKIRTPSASIPIEHPAYAKEPADSWSAGSRRHRVRSAVRSADRPYRSVLEQVEVAADATTRTLGTLLALGTVLVVVLVGGVPRVAVVTAGTVAAVVTIGTAVIATVVAIVIAGFAAATRTIVIVAVIVAVVAIAAATRTIVVIAVIVVVMA